jgi:hypothetical protein
MVEDAGVHEENHGQLTGKCYDFRLRVEYTLYVIYKARVIVESQNLSFINNDLIKGLQISINTHLT